MLSTLSVDNPDQIFWDLMFCFDLILLVSILIILSLGSF